MPSDAAGALAAEPGAAELRGIVETIATASPEHARDTARRVVAGGEAARAAADALTRPAAGLESGWQGEGAQAFGDWARAFGRAGAGTDGRAREIAAALDEVAVTLEGMRSEVGTQVEAALSAAAAARAQAAAVPSGAALPGPGAPPGPAPGLADQMAAAALAEPTAAARAAVARAEATLRGLADRITAAARQANAFGVLPTVGDTQVAPTGGPRPWTVRPRPEPPPVAVPPATPPAAPPATPTRAVTGGGGDPGGPGDDTGPGEGDLVGPGSGADPDGAAPSPALPPGRLTDWIAEAMRILAANGTDPSTMNAADIALIIEHESGGDPGAINQVDSNAARGVPSQGLMQTIPPTFEAHKLPGHDDITNPIDNIIAGVRYAVERYGSTSRVPGVASIAEGAQYRPY